MTSINHKYVVGQEVKFGNKTVEVVELREFFDKPTYLVHWRDGEDNLYKAVLKEHEIS